MSGFNSLAVALEGWFATKLCDLPDALRQRVDEEFWPMPWDKLTAHERRDVAQQNDNLTDPGLQQARQFGWDHADRKIAILNQITKGHQLFFAEHSVFPAP